MKKSFKFYIIIWAVLLALFNVIAFVSENLLAQEKYTASFWIGYGLITVAFLAQLFCSYKAFQADTAQKAFYNFSLIYVSYIGLVVSFIVGGLCMLIPSLPYWVGAIVCAVVLAMNIIAIVKATAAVEVVNAVDGKVKRKTYFIRSLTVEADVLVARAKSREMQAECRKVYEVVRYSDPMSDEALQALETQIETKFSDLKEAVEKEDTQAVKANADEVVLLLGERNTKCKFLK